MKDSCSLAIVVPVFGASLEDLGHWGHIASTNVDIAVVLIDDVRSETRILYKSMIEYLRDSYDNFYFIEKEVDRGIPGSIRAAHAFVCETKWEVGELRFFICDQDSRVYDDFRSIEFSGLSTAGMYSPISKKPQFARIIGLPWIQWAGLVIDAQLIAKVSIDLPPVNHSDIAYILELTRAGYGFGVYKHLNIVHEASPERRTRHLFPGIIVHRFPRALESLKGSLWLVRRHLCVAKRNWRHVGSLFLLAMLDIARLILLSCFGLIAK